MARASKKIILNICPNCKSKYVNQVAPKTSYCKICCVEFDHFSGKVYSIMYDGNLVDYYVNEFMDIV